MSACGKCAALGSAGPCDEHAYDFRLRYIERGGFLDRVVDVEQIRAGARREALKDVREAIRLDARLEEAAHACDFFSRLDRIEKGEK